MRREDRGRAQPQEARIHLRNGEPLEVDDVCVEQREPCEPERMLRELQRQPQPRAAEESRAQRIEELAAPVPVRLGHRAEAEPGRDELHLGARARESRRERVVVRGRERRRIREDDPHGRLRYAAMPLVVRTWNVFHGNTVPPGRRAHLRAMLDLALADDPDILCLQELPSWSLRLLHRWTKRETATARARPSVFVALPIPSRLGRALTATHHGLLRSAFTGQGIATLVSPRFELREHQELPLNPTSFRADQAQALGLEPRTARLWAGERRVAQAAILASDGRELVAVNLHATSCPDRRLATAELHRAAAWARELAAERPLVFAGRLQRRAGPLAALRRARRGRLLTRGRRNRPRPRARPPRRARRGALARRSAAASAVSSFRITLRWIRFSHGDARELPGPARRRLPERRLGRPARDGDRRGDAGRGGARPRRGPRRAAVVPPPARRARAGARAPRGARPRRAGAGRAHRLDERRLPGRPRRARPGPRRRGRHDERTSTSACSAPSTRAARACASRSSTGSTERRRSPRSRRRSARGRVYLRSRRCSGRPGPASPSRSCAARPASRSSSTARSRSARSTSTAPPSTSSPSRPRNGSAAPRRRVRSSCATRTRCASRGRPTWDRTATSTTAASSRGPARRGSTPSSRAPPRRRASSRRSTAFPPDAFERGRAAAARCRELLASRVDVVTAPGQAGLVSWRDADAAATAARLAEAGVVVRDIPGRDLVRASCGWWTSDEDVARLVAAL